MKKVKQWEKPEMGVVARSGSKEAAVTPGRGYIGPAPAPSSGDEVIRRGDTRSYLGLGPLPPVLE